MPSHDEIKDAIRELIVEIAEDMDIDESEVQDDSHLVDDLELDSMALLEVLAGMEKEFGVKIPESDFPKLISIDKCTETVEEYLEK
ncbi:acyl carrier protein [Chitinivibrio alkaliphilus]|uniref:Acyl carrier protein n=1 Tax=Chitinivibrio alkaliphilus ACht1 TaxID=1313304 RepID=U7DCL3_9BACT|nr:phosphopantetheine-binding protein [Chitinivibrio alkaliphilus]ERP32185.1 acyl carrier protein [Chitinivibrio alkaliphilus ACht1]